MKTILLVSTEPSVRAAVSGAFRLHCDEFSVLQVGEAHKAVEAMRTHRVDLLLTAPCAPVLECFRLLAYLLNYRPRQPVMMMSTRKAQKGGPARASFLVPHVPLSLDGPQLVARVRACLEERQGEPRPGVTLPGLIDVLHQERATCRLLVCAGPRRGKLHLLSGELVHARYQQAEGDEAAFQVLGWQAPQVLLFGQLKDLRQTLNLRTHRLLTLLAQGGGRALARAGTSRSKAMPQIHHALPGPEREGKARHTRAWAAHAHHRLAWWEDKPAAAWQWWPAGAKPKDG